MLSLINPVSFSSEEMNSSDEFVVLAGILELYSQLDPNSNKEIFRAPDPLQCIEQIILDIIGVSTLYEDYKNMVQNGHLFEVCYGVLLKDMPDGQLLQT